MLHLSTCHGEYYSVCENSYIMLFFKFCSERIFLKSDDVIVTSSGLETRFKTENLH